MVKNSNNKAGIPTKKINPKKALIIFAIIFVIILLFFFFLSDSLVIKDKKEVERNTQETIQLLQINGELITQKVEDLGCFWALNNGIPAKKYEGCSYQGIKFFKNNQDRVHDLEIAVDSIIKAKWSPTGKVTTPNEKDGEVRYMKNSDNSTHVLSLYLISAKTKNLDASTRKMLSRAGIQIPALDNDYLIGIRASNTYWVCGFGDPLYKICPPSPSPAKEQN